VYSTPAPRSCLIPCYSARSHTLAYKSNECQQKEPARELIGAKPHQQRVIRVRSASLRFSAFADMMLVSTIAVRRTCPVRCLALTSGNATAAGARKTPMSQFDIICATQEPDLSTAMKVVYQWNYGLRGRGAAQFVS
jgi:hypothetical protein